MAFTHDVIVIGAGSGGLTVAGGLAQLGQTVALVEAGAMGGECLNTGCVPSKALIAAARCAQTVRDARRFGIGAGEPAIDWAGVRTHVEGAIAAIAPHDSAERFAAWGCDIVRGRARLTDRRTVQVDGRALRAPRIVLATGSRPRVPPIAGLDAVPVLTNETLFKLAERPRRLLILGGGPIGCEMAQAFRRLDAEVVLIESDRLLAKSDPDAAAVVADRLRQEGVEIVEHAEATRVAGAAGAIQIALADGRNAEGSHILVATGRAARVDGLGLGTAGVAVDAGGIRVDPHLRTTARGIYAIGDCRAGPRFTHAAGYEGARLVMSLGFGVPAKVDYRALPRVTYTDPELAEVGQTEAEARAAGGRIEVRRAPFADNDRAVTDGATAGFCKIIRRNGRLVGAAIVGAHAGELLAPFVLAISGAKPTLWSLSGMILPYPTRAEIAKAVAFSAYETRIFSQPARAWSGALAKLRRLTSR